MGGFDGHLEPAAEVAKGQGALSSVYYWSYVVPPPAKMPGLCFCPFPVSVSVSVSVHLSRCCINDLRIR